MFLRNFALVLLVTLPGSLVGCSRQNDQGNVESIAVSGFTNYTADLVEVDGRVECQVTFHESLQDSELIRQVVWASIERAIQLRKSDRIVARAFEADGQTPLKWQHGGPLHYLPDSGTIVWDDEVKVIKSEISTDNYGADIEERIGQRIHWIKVHLVFAQEPDDVEIKKVTDDVYNQIKKEELPIGFYLYVLDRKNKKARSRIKAPNSDHFKLVEYDKQGRFQRNWSP